MNTPTHHSRSFRPHACQKCGGDAFFDGGEAMEWRCLQCGKPMPLSSKEATAQLAMQWNWLPSSEQPLQRRQGQT